MNRGWMLPALVIAGGLLLRLPTPAVDVAKLEPVELVFVTQEAGAVTVQTDTGARGSGDSLAHAVERLREGADGVVFLDTAVYLLVSRELNAVELCQIFRPDCQVCYGQPGMELEGAAAYLDVHPPRLRLWELRAGAILTETLAQTEGGWSLAAT